MPYLFRHTTDGWLAERLQADAPMHLLLTQPLRLGPAVAEMGLAAGRFLARHDGGWALLQTEGSPGLLRHNGLSLSVGIRLLEHGDSLMLDDEDRGVHFSTERDPARVEPAPPGLEGVCPRCRGELLAGQDAVRCPGCGLWHHQNEGGLSCFTYAPTCASCSHPTQLGMGLQWTPQVL